MENATRTVYGASVQTDLYLGLPHQFTANTTLNEALGINANTTPTSSEQLSLKAWVIGSRGHAATQGTGGQVLLTPLQHRATDANLFTIMPFVLRPANNDIPAPDRAKYCLRKELQIGGNPYIGYYGRRINYTGVTSGMSQVTVDSNGVETITPFVPDSSNLNPQPVNTSNTNTNVIDGRYVRATARIKIAMTEDEADEYRNAALIIYGSENYAMVSEIGLVTGVNRDIQSVDSGGTQVTMNELLGAQIGSHVPALNPIAFNNNGFELELDVGVREPLFNVTIVTSTP